MVVQCFQEENLLAVNDIVSRAVTEESTAKQTQVVHAGRSGRDILALVFWGR